MKYYIISGLNLEDNNRGTAALGYGAFPFLSARHEAGGLTALTIQKFIKPWKYCRPEEQELDIDGGKIVLKSLYIWFLDLWIYHNIPFLARFTYTSRLFKKVSFVAAINGGDGFSDIYGTPTFTRRLMESDLAIRSKTPLIILPQTLGPFKEVTNYETAKKILTHASKVYVRDTKFTENLDKMSVDYELTKDLSYYMVPESIDIDIPSNAVGLNISGLCYSNKFRDLTGCFDAYKTLMSQIVAFFQQQNVPLYLVSHSYNYDDAEETNDDLQASQEFYEKLDNKSGVFLVNRNLNSPETKYLISRFSFFVGTRMHANFAAIFTKTPVFGLAYSYKYEGAFRSLGFEDDFMSVINIESTQVPVIIEKIKDKYTVICNVADKQ